MVSESIRLTFLVLHFHCSVNKMAVHGELFSNNAYNCIICLFQGLCTMIIYFLYISVELMTGKIESCI